MDEKNVVGVAYLSNNDEYTTFSYDDQTIKFFTGTGLKRYVRVKEWKNELGYLVVDCENSDSSVEEDYIDLVPILNNLYVDSASFLKNIKEVRISYVN